MDERRTTFVPSGRSSSPAQSLLTYKHCTNSLSRRILVLKSPTHLTLSADVVYIPLPPSVRHRWVTLCCRLMDRNEQKLQLFKVIPIAVNAVNDEEIKDTCLAIYEFISELSVVRDSRTCMASCSSKFRMELKHVLRHLTTVLYNCNIVNHSASFAPLFIGGINS